MSSDQSYILPLNSYEILKILYLADFLLTGLLTYLLIYLLTLLIYLLTYLLYLFTLLYLLTLLMPSDKYNSRTARARDLISSLINITSSRDVPFHQPQQLQCLYHGATFVPLCAFILSSQLHKVTI